MQDRPLDAAPTLRPRKPAEAAHQYEEKHPAAPRLFEHLNGRLRVFATDPAPFFAAGLEEVLQRRMKSLPITATNLAVRVLPFKRTGCHWIGTAVTPWSVQAIFACGDKTHWKVLPAGVAVDLKLAGGEFTFLSVKDSILGQYLMCSLKSPVTDFADQAAADAFARVCLELMTTKGEKTPVASQSMPRESRPAAHMSRRELFTVPLKETT